MNYIPITDKDRQLMLKSLNIKSEIELFKDIPPKLILEKPLNLPKELSEFELKLELDNISKKNILRHSFLGAGIYNHYVPSTVNAILSRGEFYTAYTPYQPEISQGTLQSIFEYQSMICDLTGMDVSNASMYDGASSLAEAMIMATKIKKNNQIYVSKALNPLYMDVLKTYALANSIKLIEIPVINGITDVQNFSFGNAAGIIIQNPNFFGQLEPLSQIREKVKEQLFISSTTEVLSWAILKPFNEYGVDLVTAEGQSFGNNMNFGGPGLGIMAVKNQYMRQLPGRIVGQTNDTNGKRGFVLTLSTREQHIRREKATSNICSNEGLCALAASVYLATIGRNLSKLSILNHKLAVYFSKRLKKIGFEIVFNNPFFNEFVVRKKSFNLPKNVEFGLSLEKYYSDMRDCYLLCCTELTSKEIIDQTIEELQ